MPETQLALSLAFVNGQIGAGSFTRYVRRIEQDIDTIALNRTAVGFSDGDHTFGWRFYPRVQDPPVAGNLQVAFQDLLIGAYGPGYKLRHERLEPGIRECVALVIMPSFIPGVDFDVIGNWFRLAHPKSKALDLKDALRLSRKVRAIQELDPGERPWPVSGRGRGPGNQRLEQVSQRLPLQRQQVDVPFENTHGGFEMLSLGVTDLAPELVGWYGAPGIDPCNDTALFLVGDNFSVHQTRVIVGGVMLDPACPAVCTSGSCVPGSGGCTPCASGSGAAGTPSAVVPDTMLAGPKPSNSSTPGAWTKVVADEPDATDEVTQAGFIKHNICQPLPRRLPRPMPSRSAPRRRRLLRIRAQATRLWRPTRLRRPARLHRPDRLHRPARPERQRLPAAGRLRR